MPRPTDRIQPMLELLRRAWERYPDQRLGQIIGNAGRAEPTDLEPFGRYCPTCVGELGSDLKRWVPSDDSPIPSDRSPSASREGRSGR